MMKVAVALLLLLAALGWFAAVMPGVYGHLPPPAQIAIYGFRLKVLPFPSERARSAIAHHDRDAADALAQDLLRRQPRLLPSESAYILAIIQHRGSSLRKSAAERALMSFLVSGRATKADLIAGQFALEAIEKDVRLPPNLQPR